MGPSDLDRATTQLHERFPAVADYLVDAKDDLLAVAAPRLWQELWVLYSRAVQADLQRELPIWQQIAAVAPGPPITPLSALDIVTWRAGRTGPATSDGSDGSDGSD